MDTIQTILNQIDYDKLLLQLNFDEVKSSDDQIRSCCGIHQGDNPNSFVLNTENGLWYCHSRCGGGDVFNLIQLIHNISFKESVVWLANFTNIDVQDVKFERTEKYKNEAKNWLNSIRKNKKRFPLVEVDIDSISSKEIGTFRNFKEETINHFGLRYVNHIKLKKRNGEEYALYSRLLFPIQFSGVNVGFSLRRIKATDMPKWSHQPVHLKTESLLYNFDAVVGSPIVVVCEGILDVWAFHEINVPAVATFGAHLTDEQYRLLLLTGADIVLAYDGDVAGMKASAHAISLLMNKCVLYQIAFDANEDPESINRMELRIRYESKSRIQ